MAKFKLSLWEYLIVALAVAVFMVSLFFYASGTSLRTYFGVFDEDATEKPIAKIETKQGSLKRELSGEVDFKLIETGTPIYNQDTLVTGPDGTAKMKLDDGSIIEIASSTMIKMSFESTIALGGISRSASIHVVTGSVTGSAKTKNIVIHTSRGEDIKLEKDAAPKTIQAPEIKPEVPAKPVDKSAILETPVLISPEPIITPSSAPSVAPTPTATIAPIPVLQAQPLSPPGDVALELPSGTTGKPSIAVPFSWELKSNVPTRFKLWYLGESKTVREKVYDESVASPAATQGQGDKRGITKTIDRTGYYEWTIENESVYSFNGTFFRSSQFSVSPAFSGVMLMDPLIAGQAVKDNHWTGKADKNFNIRLRWNAYNGASKYRVWVATTPNASDPLIEKTVSGTDFVLDQDTVFQGQFYYQVSAVMPNGSLVASKTLLFNFNFLSPTLVLPKDQAVLHAKDLAQKDGGVLITWQKTTFTNDYELEIALDPDFNKKYTSMRSAENFYIFTAPPDGEYWWRVRSYSRKFKSNFSKPYKFIIKR